MTSCIVHSSNGMLELCIETHADHICSVLTNIDLAIHSCCYFRYINFHVVRLFWQKLSGAGEHQPYAGRGHGVPARGRADGERFPAAAGGALDLICSDLPRRPVHIVSDPVIR